MNRTIALFLLLVSIFLHADVSINESVDKFHPDLKMTPSYLSPAGFNAI